MFKYFAFAFLLLFTTCQNATAPAHGDAPPADSTTSPPPPTTPEAPQLDLRIEAHDTTETSALFGEKPEFTVLIEGMEWSEGPLVLPDGRILCSDVPNNQIRYWKDGEVGVYLDNSGYASNDYSSEPGSNGLHLDSENRLVLCQHGSRRVARMNNPIEDPLPAFTILADNYQGKKFNSPNDLVIASDGSILFTDPIYGLPGRENSEIKELDFCGVYRIKPDGEVQLLTKAYDRPNGIGLSPDEKTLYIGNSDRSNFVVTATPILDENFTLGEAKVLIDANKYVGKEIGSCDGLAVAKNGRIFATAPGGVWILEPDGKLVAKVRTGTPVSNVELSPAEDYLYLASDYYLIRLKLI
ncbi:MAG: SMP-30/gluconolactonase/LRE family protein [Bacteroidota bacterium]